MVKQGGVDALPDGRRRADEATYREIRCRSALNRVHGMPFKWTLNPYRGCTHGCHYCFARRYQTQLELDADDQFASLILVKTNLVRVLRRELAKPAWMHESVAIGTATDCYQPIERELRLTRSVIELLSECEHPFALVTKSSAVEMDLDLIAPMAAKRLAAVYVTVTTLDGALARKLEPRAAAPHRRLRTIRTLAEAGVPVGVSASPQIPFINEDMEQVLEAAWEAGARSAFYNVVRLPWEVAPLFKEWLEVHYPQRADRVMGRIREMRGGKDYDSDFATRMTGTGTWAELIAQRFEKAARRIGFNRDRIAMDLSAFRPPGEPGQGSLF